MTLEKDGQLQVQLLELNQVNVVLHGVIRCVDEAIITLNYCSVEQHNILAGSGDLTLESNDASWHVGRQAALGARGSIQAYNVQLTNEGVVQADGFVDWQTVSIVNTGKVLGKEGVDLMVDQGQNAGHIVSEQGDITLSVSLATLASSNIESNHSVVFEGDKSKDVTLQGKVAGKSLHVVGQNLNNQAEIVVSDKAHLEISGMLNQQKKIHAGNLVFDGNQVINHGSINVGTLALMNLIYIRQSGVEFVIDHIKQMGSGDAYLRSIENTKGLFSIKEGSVRIFHFSDVAQKLHTYLKLCWRRRAASLKAIWILNICKALRES